MSTTVTITATVRTSGRSAALLIAVSGAAVGETMTVARRVGASALAPVMGASSITAASRVVIDPEAPLNRAASWVVTTSTGVTVESGPITVATDLAAIADPVTGATADCAVITRDALTRTNRAEVLQVEGDSTPWVVWDVPVGKQMPIEILTLTDDDAAALDKMLSTGDPILLRCGCLRHTDVWVQPVGESTGQSPLVKRAESQLRTWSLGECVVYGSNPRLGSAARSTTLGDLNNAVTPKTLGAIAARWANLGQIASADLG